MADAVGKGLPPAVEVPYRRYEEYRWPRRWIDHRRLFPERFVIDTPWAHLDIAGKAWADKSTKTVPKGGTGYGVRLLNRLIDDWQPVQVDSASES